MQVEIINQQSDITIDSQKVKQIICFLLLELDIKCDELAIHFVDVEAISELHRIFFNDPTPTDCITFPIDDTIPSGCFRMLGEIFVCPSIGIDYVRKNGGNPFEEICLYVIHGLLHLLGFRDDNEEAIQVMRKKEEWCMNKLKEKNLSLSTLNDNVLT